MRRNLPKTGSSNSKARARAGQLKTGITFRQAAEQFLREYEAITSGERSLDYVESMKMRLRVHLLPFFGDKTLREITPGVVQEYRVHRATSRYDPRTGEAMKPARSTMHQETITLRHVLKTAERHGWLAHVPNISPPYKSSGKISHRAWFSPEEYMRLYEATRERAKNPKNNRWRNASEKLHDYVLFMANTGLRPDEAKRLQFRDVTVVYDEATDKRILEIEVRGKRGVGHCKSMPGAVYPFERRQGRNQAGPTALIFGKIQRELFNTILDELQG